MTPNKEIQVKDKGCRGFSEGWQSCSEGFPKGKAQGKSQEAALPAQGNPVHPDSFTWIYILFIIGHICHISDVFKYLCLNKLIVANFLIYVSCIIKISKVSLLHCYLSKIQFYLLIFSLVQKTSNFITLFVSCN